MKIPISWLKEYVDIDLPIPELAHRITMAGIEVGEITVTGEWKNCYVGEVLTSRRHPNADRLILCTVDIGREQFEVVCGAPNVEEGQKVAFAKPGASILNYHTGATETLQSARIRGVTSNGMICSEFELGLGEEHSSILILNNNAPTGIPLYEYLGDQILELEVTPNRPDCLSVLGVAHEVAALTNVPIHEPLMSYQEKGEPIDNLACVEIDVPSLCDRYTASLISGVKVGPSPRWLRDKLSKMDMRSINNVVDITNYVMLEMGQPLHAFDFRTLPNGKIIIRQARPGEKLITLDGEDRKLDPPMLVIADSNGAVALAGIIGGDPTQITEDTTDILIESANFNYASIRHTASDLKISTEASLRFEKGLRPELAELGLRRATRLIQQVAGGTVAKGIIDIFPGKVNSNTTVTLSSKRLRKVLGVSLPMDRVKRVLASLGFSYQRKKRGVIQVTTPYWRSDISLEDDLIEEIARIVGYDNIPAIPLDTPIPHGQPQPIRELRECIRDALVTCGLQEVITYPLTSLEVANRTVLGEEMLRPLKITNPMSRQQEYLRTSLIPSLLGTLETNRRHYDASIRIFEVGRVYILREGTLPYERETAAGLLAGSTISGKEHPFLDFYHVKGVVETALTSVGIRPTFKQERDSTLDEHRSARVVVGKVVVGILGEVRDTILNDLDVEDRPVSVFSLDIEKLLDVLPSTGHKFRQIIRFPSAIRDISILLDTNVLSATVDGIILRHKLVVRTLLFDIYTGENIPQKKRSLSYRIYFQSPDRTLETEEVNSAFQEIIESLGNEAKVILRD